MIQSLHSGKTDLVILCYSYATAYANSCLRAVLFYLVVSSQGCQMGLVSKFTNSCNLFAV